MSLAALGAKPARAVDLGAGDLPTETIASRDRLRFYDAAKKYGAARVTDLGKDEPEGVRLGNFFFFPSLGTIVRYDDNIFGTHRDRVGDLVTQVTPSLRVRSSLPRHALDVAVTGKLVSYAQNDDQNYADIAASATGALHFDHAHTLSASVLSSLQHEEVTDPGRPKAAGRPVEFTYHRASVGITRDVGRLYGTLSATAAAWDYQDTRTRDGVAIDQDQRDSQLLRSQLSAGYRISPGFELRTKLAAINIWNRGTPELSRDSTGYEALAGLWGEFSPVLRWELFGGWGTRDFKQEGLATVSTYLYEGRLTWLATQRLTLYGVIGRSLAEPIDNDGNARVDTRVAAKAELELYHNLVMTLDAEAREAVFQGANRIDRTYSGRIGLDYYHSKNWLFTIAYDYQHRLSSSSDDELTRGRIMIGAKLRF